MNLPLATLRRYASVVVLRRRLGPSDDDTDSGALTFSSLQDAEQYLAYWLNDGAVLSQLRRALHDSGAPGAVSRRSDHEVTRALALKLLSGSLVLMEAAPLKERKGLLWDVPIVEPDPEPAAAAVIRPPPKKPAAKPPAPPLLPLLEKVQVEGAEVLPEIMQTLEQIDLTMGSLELAGVSLDPAPTGVAAIGAGMQKATQSVTDTMDEL